VPADLNRLATAIRLFHKFHRAHYQRGDGFLLRAPGAALLASIFGRFGRALRRLAFDEVACRVG